MVAGGHGAVARSRQESGRFAEPAGMAPPFANTLPRPRQAAAQRLAHAIEAEVVPRLLLTHGVPPSLPDLGLMYGLAPAQGEVEALNNLLLIDDAPGAFAYVEALRQQGMTLERIFLDLLSPVARRLGQCWLDDLCDFGTVMLGLLRLHHMLRDYAPGFEAAGRRRDQRRRVLITSAPGEGHSFGRDMLVRFFRRAGWDTWDLPMQHPRELTALVRKEWFAVIAFAVGSANRLDPVASSIRNVRRASRNGEIGVMVGGPAFLDHPELVALVGADATAPDAQQATMQAERLLALLAYRD